MEENNLFEIVSKLKESRKYKNICDETLYRMAEWALERHKNPKQAIKTAKRKLHQVYGAYFGQINMAAIEKLIDDLPPCNEDELLRDACKQILQCHSSTRERFPETGNLYYNLFQKVGQPSKIIDLACGLNPFTWPWMDLKSDTIYHAIDIDYRLVFYINKFFSHMGIAGSALCHDILTSTPKTESDVVFLLKALPGIEQQKKGSSIKLLKALRTHYIVVSFPIKSLGSREKGMQQYYGNFMDQLINELDSPVEIMNLSNEVFYIIDVQSRSNIGS
jgi:16S rRNA (guanine(1405)-N(7))-methyltransferase